MKTDSPKYPRRPTLPAGPPNIPKVCDGPAEPGLVSVLIPTYNRDYILGAAIESVLAQTYRPIEIVVVDDGSNDNTPAIVERFGSLVRYIYQDNGGLAVARNTGLSVARGEFIAFQDSDDLWVPWKLQVQVALMRSFPEIAISWTDMTAVDTRGDVIRERHLHKGYSAYQSIDLDETFPHSGRIRDVSPDCPPEIAGETFRYGDIFSTMFLGNLVHPPTAVMRRDTVHRTGGLDVSLNGMCEDYEFFSRIARWGFGAVVETPGMLYRIGAEDQFTHPTRNLYQARGYLAYLLRRLAEDRDRLQLPDRVIRRTLAEAYAWVAEAELMSLRGSGAAGFFWKSLRLNPFQKRPLMLLPFSLVPRPLLRIARSLKQRLAGTRSGQRAEKPPSTAAGAARPE